MNDELIQLLTDLQDFVGAVTHLGERDAVVRAPMGKLAGFQSRINREIEKARGPVQLEDALTGQVQYGPFSFNGLTLTMGTGFYRLSVPLMFLLSEPAVIQGVTWNPLAEAEHVPDSLIERGV